jgi:hypothetical protein
MQLCAEIRAGITGRLALMSDAEADALYRMVAEYSGDHVEIGTLWGATAILAGLAKVRSKRKGTVYTIDYMRGGYWDYGDPGHKNQKPTARAVVENIRKFDLQGRVIPVRSPSFPFPLPGVLPVTALIDAGHEYEPCLRDWQSMRPITTKAIAFHDYCKTHPGVMRVVDTVVRKDPEWTLREVVDTIAIFERVTP